MDGWINEETGTARQTTDRGGRDRERERDGEHYCTERSEEKRKGKADTPTERRQGEGERGDMPSNQSKISFVSVSLVLHPFSAFSPRCC
mmetsp:Transcript_13323/g.26327  ORF Transcript_13323/g.26327 Transcript_13323/m.26327 type:complete len:89 (+) Transcript_13323:235-501(+)